MASSPEEHAVKTAESDTPTRAIALLALAAFASAANLRVCDPLLPQIASELGVTVGTAALTVTAFALAYGVFQVAVGPLSDAGGRLNMVVLGSIWAGIATVISAGMPTLGPLALLRFLGGVGAAAVVPVAIAWIGDVVPYERRQAVLARLGADPGIVFGQAAGGLLGELIGWRANLAMLGVVRISAGLLLLGEMRRLKVDTSAPGRARWRQSAASAYRVLQDLGCAQC
jgi:predicted MFS family arabinose efflux permease